MNKENFKLYICLASISILSISAWHAENIIYQKLFIALAIICIASTFKSVSKKSQILISKNETNRKN